MPDQYEIDLNNAMKEVLKTVNFLKGSVKDLSGQLNELGTSGAAGVKDADKAMGDYAKTLQDKGVKSVKDFRKEQRDQNFVVRESRQALMATTMAIGFLTQGYDKSKGSVKQFSTGLLTGIAAMEATEFAMFSVGRAGASMGGKVGSVLTSISKYGGPISIFLGIAAGLIAFFTHTDEAAAKAADEGLKKYEDRIKSLSVVTAQELLKRTQAEKARLQAVVAAGTETFTFGTGEEGASGTTTRTVRKKNMSAEQEMEYIAAVARLKQMADNKEIELLQQQNTALGEQYQHLTGINKLEAELAQLRTRANETAAQSDIDAVAKKEQEIANIKLTSAQREKISMDIRIKMEEDIADLKRQEAKQHQDMVDLDNLDRQMLDDGARASEKMIDDEKKGLDDIEKQARQIAENEERYLQGLQNGLSVLDQGLASIGVKSDSLISKLIQGVQYAIQISKLMSTTGEAKNAQGGEAGTILNIAGSLLGILGLFDSGGWTGSGDPQQPAGVVHKKEFVFSAPAVERIGVSTLDRIHRQYAGYAGGGPVGSPSYAMAGGGNPLNIPAPVVHVHLHGLLEGQQFLKKEFPGFTKWDNRKKA